MMLRQELEDRLRAEGFDRLKCYSLNKDQPPVEGYILEGVGSGWDVLYFERGMTRKIAWFYAESLACDWLYKILHDEYASVLNRKIN
jgi:hypothetical protein